jgi:hypothetical protein
VWLAIFMFDLLHCSVDRAHFFNNRLHNAVSLDQKSISMGAGVWLYNFGRLIYMQ